MSIIGSAAELSGLEPDDVLDIGLDQIHRVAFDGDFWPMEAEDILVEFWKEDHKRKADAAAAKRSQIHLGVEHVRRGVLYHLQIHHQIVKEKKGPPPLKN